MKVGTAALERPQQVLVLLRTGTDDVSIRGDDFGRQQIVDAQTVVAAQPADAAAEGKPA